MADMTGLADLSELADLAYSRPVTFHLHARLFRGCLSAPIRNELQTAEGSNRPELEDLAEDLASRGFHVWLYEATGVPTVTDRDPWRVVREWRPYG